jgi:hypothetical protein
MQTTIVVFGAILIALVIAALFPVVAVLLTHVRGFAVDFEHTHLENCPFLLGFLNIALRGSSKV